MVCLDTSFIVDLLQGRESARKVVARLEMNNEKITITSPTIMEIISGAQQSNLKNDEATIIELLTSLKVLSFAEDEAILAGRIEAELVRRGEMIDSEDIMIGAIARQHGEVLLTKNVKHFERIPELRIEKY